MGGIDKGEAETKPIAKDLEERIQKLGSKRRQGIFFSHYFRQNALDKRQRKLVEQIQKLSMQGFDSRDGLEFTVDKITIYKSTLSQKDRSMRY